MSDLKKMSMSELIALYNSKAATPVTEFKNLAAARAAVASLEMKMSETNDLPVDGAVEGTPAPVATGDKAKYNSTGKRGPNQGVGAFAKELIAAGQDNATVLKAVLEKFPGAKTTTGCIAFYRTALKTGGKVTGPSAEALRAKAQALLDQATAVEVAAAAAAAAAAAPVESALV